MKKFTILAALCCFVLASCGGGAKSDSPSAIVKTMNGYTKSGDYEKAVKFWVDNTDMSDSKKEQTQEEVTQFVTLFSSKLKAEVDKHGGIESFEITEETIAEDGNSAVVKSVTTYKDGKTDNQKVNLVKVDGKWMFENDK